MPTLDLTGVSKKYGEIEALTDISLHVEDKEYVCILGPSGCGKSTLIRCIAGIHPPDSGQILIDGKPVDQIEIEDRQIGYVFQDIALFPNMSVRDNLSYGLAVRRAQPSEKRAVTNEMLTLINMRDRSESYPRELSGSAQQKVAIGRAIATGSHLFLLDEPLGALDALVRTELRYELKKLASDLGLTVLHVTHDQQEALSIADRVVVMKNGRIVEVGKPSEIYRSPSNIFTENFVGETNLLEGRVLETDTSNCIVDIRGHRLRVAGLEKKVDQRVVVAIRPESIQLTTQSDVGWPGVIKQVTFLGDVNRYVVDIEREIEIIAEESTAVYSTGFRTGESVGVVVGSDAHMLIFDYPKEGLEREVSLE